MTARDHIVLSIVAMLLFDYIRDISIPSRLRQPGLYQTDSRLQCVNLSYKCHILPIYAVNMLQA